MPENPGGQLQLNPFLRSVHIPLFKQGLLSHSFISEENMIKNYLQINICPLFTKRVLLKFFFEFFFCTKINMNAKLMDPKGRHHLNVGSVLVK